MKTKQNLFRTFVIIGTCFLGVSSQTLAANCNYTLGTAKMPNGKAFIMDSISSGLKKALEEKGYSKTSVYEADLMLNFEASEMYYGFILGSVAKVTMKDVITKEVLYSGQSGFTPGLTVDDMAAIQDLPNCQED